MIDLDKILEGLVQRTADGKLKWSRSIGSDRFVTSLDAISLVIVKSDGIGYRLEILDESGEAIEVLDFSVTTEEQDKQLERLHIQARRSALNIQSTLEKLAKALDL